METFPSSLPCFGALSVCLSKGHIMEVCNYLVPLRVWTMQIVVVTIHQKLFIKHDG
jgi:hypothetical protein